MTRWTSTPAVGAGALVVVLLTSACTGGTGSGGGSSSSSTTGTTTSSATASTGSTVSRADATDSAPPPRPAASAAGLSLGDEERYSGGDGGLTWQVWLPVFTSGPAEVVNRKVRASADYAVRAATDAGALTITGEGEVVTNDGRTVQVRIGVAESADAAPVEVVTTVALTADDATPVFLEQQLADPADAWGVLADEATAAAASQGLTAARPLAAEAAEFADWQTSADGLELSFQHGQFGAGAPVVVVPWSSVLPLLTPEGKALLAP
ncbi:MAG: hypothetical protein PGN11_19535 [Quadrisphaera sp.]